MFVNMSPQLFDLDLDQNGTCWFFGIAPGSHNKIIINIGIINLTVHILFTSPNTVTVYAYLLPSSVEKQLSVHNIAAVLMPVTLTVSTWHNHGPHRMIVNKLPSSAKIVTNYFNYYICRVRIVHKVILIQQHLPNISCCVSCSRSWRHLPILERIPIGKLSKTQKFSIRTNGEFAQNALPKVFWIL